MPLTCADFEFHIGLKPKARPRHVSGGPSYMPADYKKWIKEMRAQMAEHWTEPPLPVVNVLWCKFYGPARSDLDNLLGAVMDAGNGLIWRDDRVFDHCPRRGGVGEGSPSPVQDPDESFS